MQESKRIGPEHDLGGGNAEVSRDQVRSLAPNFWCVQSASAYAPSVALLRAGNLVSMHSPTQSTGTASEGQHNEFVHKIAIKLSRAINSINPNDLFARRVIEIAKSNANDLQQFINGENLKTGLLRRHVNTWFSIMRSGSWFWEFQGSILAGAPLRNNQS